MSGERPPAELVALLGPYMARQRWAARGEADLSAPEVVDSELMLSGEPGLWWLLVDAGGARYQVIVGVRPAERPVSLGERDIVGTYTPAGSEDELLAYDALTDPELVRHLVALLGVDGLGEAVVRSVGAEQSNSSLVLDEKVIVKFFRRLQPGHNPDIEVTTGLDRVGFNHIPTPLGLWRRGDYDLAVAQEYLAGGSEGWSLALTSLRDLYGNADPDPRAAGGDFSSESRRLGEMTAKLHVALSEAFGAEPSRVDDWVAELTGRLDQLKPAADVRAGVERMVEAVRGLGDPGPSIRIHGDYHLGQVMRTDSGWFVLDFEGEPARSLELRRRTSPALKDVAGMLRSFDYAAAVARMTCAPDEQERLVARGDEWVEANRQAFLEGYLGWTGIETVLPPGRGRDVVLAFFELDKALYELGYERAHRPDWTTVPERAIARLVAG